MAAGLQESPRTIELEPTVPDSLALRRLLEDLYRQEQARNPHDMYLHEHRQPLCIENQVRTFHWYRPHLPERGSILDWGCRHAPDSCLLRAWFQDRLDLHSCDFFPRVCHQAFHDYAQTSYVVLDDEVRLPYPNNFFDAVIGSGVLEHTALDYESLKEVRRVLKPDGVLIVSYLPNWLSLNEWRRRTFQKKDFHRRLYGRSEAQQLLKHSGFYPITSCSRTFLWERLATAVGLGRWEQEIAGVLTRLLPVHVFSSTLSFIARKVLMM